MDFLCPPAVLGRVNLMARFMAIRGVLFCFADPFSYQYTRDRRLNQYLRISSNVTSVNDLPRASILATILAFTNISIVRLLTRPTRLMILIRSTDSHGPRRHSNRF